jgi:predicted RecB family nuclease
MSGYRKLRRKCPDVCSEVTLRCCLTPRAIDLYLDVVLKATEWPTRDFSIKTLAKYLGFEWRDPHPSGAASNGLSAPMSTSGAASASGSQITAAFLVSTR